MNAKKLMVFKVRDCLLKAFSSIYVYHPTDDGESEDLRMHISIDLLIFLQYLIFTGSIGVTKILGIIWAIYLCSLALKIAFYFCLHPWAEILRKDFSSIKKAIKDPKMGIPNKSKYFPFCHRLETALMYELTICNHGKPNISKKISILYYTYSTISSTTIQKRFSSP